MIVTNQPSSPHEERTRFYFEPDGTLVLEWGGQRHWFRREEARTCTLIASNGSSFPRRCQPGLAGGRSPRRSTQNSVDAGAPSFLVVSIYTKGFAAERQGRWANGTQWRTQWAQFPDRRHSV